LGAEGRGFESLRPDQFTVGGQRSNPARSSPGGGPYRTLTRTVFAGTNPPVTLLQANTAMS
jgi:hypothetical protein